MSATLPRPIRGVIFDMDGTLTVPVIDFGKMRFDLGIPDSETDILHALMKRNPAEREAAFRIIEEHESDASARSELSRGARELCDFLIKAGIRTGVATRNSRISVEAFVQKHGVAFDAVVSRDDAEPKPSAEPLRRAAELAGLTLSEIIYVGDHEIDRLTGEAAGVPTFIIKNHTKCQDNGTDAMRLEHLGLLIPIIHEANGL
jgi:HAD superfamily hydrolase (TIGR01549 family)